MYKEKLFDNYFKFLALFFWPIMWYKWIVISNGTLENMLFTTYAIIAIVFIILYSVSMIKYKDITQIDFFYRISTLLAFIFTLFSFLIYPKSLFFLYLKIIFTGIYLYYSIVKTLKFKDDEGVVGIMSSLLLIVITLFY
ncbi:TPA: hypothetical protein JD074_03495 [Clostridioides difficile]|uniref:Membrane protein n=2 Tax=Clostridioides difficile TaxID=1496 RepID=A0AAX3H3B0_CLODI|nr:hypothetical protein C4E42_06435 [Clostridioides difficile]EFH06628.1 hypothetical protein HMPREF0220_2338 [Clostridioides difficile NAP08]EFH14620.1 hypothetical protein HMPREF0219_2783 [Clostridioides difficile NAP07]CCK90149.1 Putative membrane protein [Clostridioides difficile T5]CCK93514.1 Putative membrane protein [Clostridioides difficile T20]CCK97291.1 Putative membrane protein [Clostridioides difficile E1]CCL01317.1 Putative membrane protein [Clostridioides difficile E10]SHO35950